MSDERFRHAAYHSARHAAATAFNQDRFVCHSMFIYIHIISIKIRCAHKIFRIKKYHVCPNTYLMLKILIALDFIYEYLNFQ